MSVRLKSYHPRFWQTSITKNEYSQFAYFITIDIQQTDKLLTVQMRTLIMYC